MAPMVSAFNSVSGPKANHLSHGLPSAARAVAPSPVTAKRHGRKAVSTASTATTTIELETVVYTADELSGSFPPPSLAKPVVKPVKAATKPAKAAPAVNVDPAELDLRARHAHVQKSFPTAMGIDDFIARIEVVLSSLGFTGDNTIAMTNLCRDEVTVVMKDKIEGIFGSSFNTNGLGAVLTCGATGMGAGLSHSPICSAGRERYVFFSFPHIAIDGQGTIGSITRPGRAGRSCACGALQKCLNEFKSEAASETAHLPSLHDPLDPEYSILKQRLARRLRYENADLQSLDLPSLTSVAERTITNDLEYLIEKSIDPTKADYAVITGVQIHNWASDLVEGGAPSMEFAAPTTVYAVVNGKKIGIDLSKVPGMSPRQLMMLGAGGEKALSVVQGHGSTLQEIPYSYLSQRLGGATTMKPAKESVVDPDAILAKRNKKHKPAWQLGLARRSDYMAMARAGYDPDMGAANMDVNHVNTSFQVADK